VEYALEPVIEQNSFELLPGEIRTIQLHSTARQEFDISAEASSGLDVSVSDNATGETCAAPAVISTVLRCNLRRGHYYVLTFADSRTGERAKIGILAGVLSRGKSANLAPNRVTVAAYKLTRDGRVSRYFGEAPRPVWP
jgi:hypothetical protein